MENELKKAICVEEANMNGQYRLLVLFGGCEYNVLNEMLSKLADYLEKQGGFFVGRYWLNDYVDACRLDWDIVLSVQGAEFIKNEKADNKIHITCMVDHPVYLLPRILSCRQRENLWVGYVDKRHVEYLKRYYGMEHVFFAPLFGWKTDKEILYRKRKYDIFFPASYTRWEEDVACQYPELNDTLRALAEDTIVFMVEHIEYSMEDALEAVLRGYGITDMEVVRQCMDTVGPYMDSYVRIYARNKVVHALLNAGITLTVCGRNWSEFPENEIERAHLRILGELPYSQVVEIMADSRIVLNVMPWFKDGCHDRIAMGCINGALCVTDASVYLKEVFGEEGLVYYDWRKPEKLVQILKMLRQEPDKAEKIAERGQRIAEQNLSVASFAKIICNRIEKACGEMPERGNEV